MRGDCQRQEPRHLRPISPATPPYLVDGRDRLTSRELATRLDPEDIVQSVFRTFFRRAAQGHYDVPAGEEIWKLLLVIALNKIRAVGAYHRAAKRDVRQTAGGETFDVAIESESGRDETSLTVLKMVIDEVLAGLPEAHRR